MQMGHSIQMVLYLEKVTHFAATFLHAKNLLMSSVNDFVCKFCTWAEKYFFALLAGMIQLHGRKS